ncbi:MAG: transglutaminase family protein [Candidatus Marinimicrobia bacterium]|nr:transglutaminase family protein [Candidatus Neomarinimicrobiota bacterium]
MTRIGVILLQDPSKIFDINAPAIRELIKERNWDNLVDKNKVVRILNFVKNDIVFGFSKKPLLSASQVLAEGRGYALTKSILLKTLLDSCGILCRFHAFTVKKELYQGLTSPLNYNMLPNNLISAWIEVFQENQWLVADGVLLDAAYFDSLQSDFHEAQKEFAGFGCSIFLDGNIHTAWNGKNHTYCQRAAITRDLGIIEQFDWFFTEFTKDFKLLGKISAKQANKVIYSRRFSK